MKKIFFSALCLSSILASRAAMPSDSLDVDTTAVELKGVEIEARMQSTSSKGSSFIPTAREKKASNNGYFLLQNIGIPELTVQPLSGAVSTVTGDDVALFINYLPATKEEVDGMRTADVRRVEVLRSPSDPRFGGASNVVNFIVQPYEYGGYTKLSDMMFAMNCFSNTATLYSKFSYKKWTFDLSTYAQNVRMHHLGSSGCETFSLAAPEGDVVRDQLLGHADIVNNSYPVSLRAQYVKNGMSIVNTLGFQFSENPRSDTSGSLRLSLDGAGSYDYSNAASRTTRQAWWNGGYYFQLPADVQLNVAPQFNYSNSSRKNAYATTLPGAAPIINNSSENSYVSRLDITGVKKLTGLHTVGLNLTGVYRRFDVDYTGSNPYSNTLDHGVFAVNPAYYYTGQKVFLKADAGVCGDWSSINGELQRDIYPFAHLECNYSPNNKNSIRFFGQYATNETEISERSPNVLQSNELLYYTGNPDLENARRVDLSLTYSWMPSNTFSLTAFGLYGGTYDRVVAAYYPYLDGSAVIRRYENSGNYHSGQLGLSARLTLLKRKLMVMLSPTQNFYRSTGFYDISHNPLALTAYAQYFLGPVYFTASYSIASKTLSERGVWSCGRSNLSLSAGWSNSDWNIAVYAQNLLHGDYLISTGHISSPVYASTTRSYGADGKRSLVFSVSYTFGYGKKIRRGDEVSTGTSAASGVLE